MTRRPERGLIVAVIAGAAVGTAAAVAGLVMGFGLPLPLWTLGGIVVAVAWWGLRRLLPEIESEAVPEPQHPPQPWSTGVDRRTRVLETRLRGAQGGRSTTATALHDTIAELAETRAANAPLPDRLQTYLRSEPRTLSRAQLRTILRELTRL
ncbi:hypothetical protein [Microbacterium sp.]|uniref:hypothetical protein n=1 Tax=Microbacterium sp. TaxID=51671 RepID=UPI0028A1240A|nr:hypothetical protein [Microbacterium sp.]